jgi:hypothetical protein
VPSQQLHGQLQTQHSVITLTNNNNNNNNNYYYYFIKKSKLSLRDEKSKICTFTIVMPLWGEKELCTYVHTYMLRTISVLLWCKDHYKIWLRKTFLAPNTSTSLQTTLSAEAHLAEGQFLLEQTLNKAKSLMYRTGTRRPAIIKTGQNLEPK